MHTVSVLRLQSISFDDGAAEHDGGRALGAGRTDCAGVRLGRHSERTASVLDHFFFVRSKLAVRCWCTDCVLDAV